MRRSPSVSTRLVVFGCCTQLNPGHKNGLKAATGILVGPVNVELPGLAKSTWNLYKFKEFAPKSIMKLGEPAGGNLCPSTSAGRKLPTVEACWKQICVAASP